MLPNEPILNATNRISLLSFNQLRCNAPALEQFLHSQCRILSDQQVGLLDLRSPQIRDFEILDTLAKNSQAVPAEGKLQSYHRCLSSIHGSSVMQIFRTIVKWRSPKSIERAFCTPEREPNENSMKPKGKTC